SRQGRRQGPGQARILSASFITRPNPPKKKDCNLLRSTAPPGGSGTMGLFNSPSAPSENGRSKHFPSTPSSCEKHRRRTAGGGPRRRTSPTADTPRDDFRHPDSFRSPSFRGSPVCPPPRE